MKKLLLSIALLISTPSLGHSEEAILWKEINGWSVRMDQSMGNACYISTVYDDETILRVGYDFSSKNRSIYFAVGNDKWQSLETGKDYQVQIQFDSNPVWNANATAIDLSGTRFLATSTQDVNFLSEFQRKQALRITFNGRRVTSLRLKGSASAVHEILDCQDATNEALGPNTSETLNDPFSAKPAGQTRSDPFEL